MKTRKTASTPKVGSSAVVRPVWGEAIATPISPGSRGDRLMTTITSLLIEMGEGDDTTAQHLAIGAVVAISKRQGDWPNATTHP